MWDGFGDWRGGDGEADELLALYSARQQQQFVSWCVHPPTKLRTE